MTDDGILRIEPVAYIRTDFTDKFGLPRQSGLIPALKGEIVFQPAYSQPDAVRGLDAFSHIWLIWGFHAAEKQSGKGWSATVRPPRLGGNTRVGVFASRAPFRPNGLGMSCVRLESVLADTQPVRLIVSGIDLLDGTPIYDIKPYIPVADCKPEASEGYTEKTRQYGIRVEFPAELLAKLPADKQDAAVAVLEQDPRPGYADDPARIYGVSFAGYDIRFRAADGVLTVCAVCEANHKGV
ncbi:MAG: tRNA (N6-threonylcarbamoyladenosine(37)-N6)-methyltransferase TrmO [Oscillospiraceae bacterium]|nr:tRNA (N6-threonylcarbamoyladenosine(37)-N6)-methyltransferase TrmO [Oscillospiraceae bacterium]